MTDTREKLLLPCGGYGMDDPRLLDEAKIMLRRIAENEPAAIMPKHARAILDAMPEGPDTDSGWIDVRLLSLTQPHRPTVSAALREVVGALYKLDVQGSMSSFQDALAQRAREIEEDREDG